MTEAIQIKHSKVVGVRTSIFTIFHPEKYDPRLDPMSDDYTMIIGVLVS